jgi:hypothetical protein
LLAAAVGAVKELQVAAVRVDSVLPQVCLLLLALLTQSLLVLVVLVGLVAQTLLGLAEAIVRLVLLHLQAAARVAVRLMLV